MLQNWLVVIPARLGSTRLPRKPLYMIGDRPLIAHTWDNLAKIRDLGAKVLVATDAEEIVSAGKIFQFDTRLTSSSHLSGTDRVQEVAQKENCPFILNVQGDEPRINTDDLINLMEKFSQSQGQMATLGYFSHNKNDFISPHAVKIVISSQNQALYFSRAPIPHFRDEEDFSGFWHHQGIYAFNKTILEKFCKLPIGQLEKFEKLEQLRALEAGIIISVYKATQPSLGIDTEEDVKKFHEFIKNGK